MNFGDEIFHDDLDASHYLYNVDLCLAEDDDDLLMIEDDDDVAMVTTESIIGPSRKRKADTAGAVESETGDFVAAKKLCANTSEQLGITHTE